MERLTDNTNYCTSWADCEIQGRCELSENCYERRLYNKLREYEDAEEKGLLARLPCKVWDIVFEASRTWKMVLERNVASIAIYKNSIWIRNGCGDSFEYGIEVFLTMEEAEAALERMGDEYEN